MVRHIGVRGADDVLQGIGAIQPAALCGIDGADIVMLTCLTHQLPHGLPDGQAAGNGHKIGGHHTARLVLIIGANGAHIPAGIIVQQRYQLPLHSTRQVFQHIHRVVGIHLRQHLRRTPRLHLLQISSCILGV